VPPDLPNSVAQGFSIEHHKILAQRDRHKSAQIGTIDTCQNENATIGRTKAQNPRCSAQKKGNIQRHETIADKSLQAFLAAIAVRKRDEIRHRYNLKKEAQVGTRSTQIISNHHDRHMPKRGSKVACCKEKARLSPWHEALDGVEPCLIGLDSDAITVSVPSGINGSVSRVSTGVGL